MFHYRLYFMESRTGHIMRFNEYEAEDDEAAIALAQEHEGDHPLELWCERRKVVRIESADPLSRLAAHRPFLRDGHTQPSKPGT